MVVAQDAMNLFLKKRYFVNNNLHKKSYYDNYFVYDKIFLNIKGQFK